jgi:uncharacterized protein YndB with AHSA1/START domain
VGSKCPHASRIKGELVITRVINAEREWVWNAWTDPEQFKTWWGPRMFTTPFSRMDVRVGGNYLTSMRSPDGKDYWSTGVYREVVPRKRLVMADSFSDDKGNKVPGTYYGMAVGFREKMLITVTFEDVDGRTELNVKISGVKSIKEPNLANMKQGWNESLDKLAETLEGPEGEVPLAKRNPFQVIIEPGKQEIVVNREFDTPREPIFLAFTLPGLYVQWIGGKGVYHDFGVIQASIRRPVAVRPAGQGWSRVRLPRGKPRSRMPG